MPEATPTNKKGLVIAYIGDGKGKTSAAMGLVARASGAGLNVYVLQFVKAKVKDEPEPGELPLSSEIEFFNNVSAPRNLGKIETEQAGLGFVGILGDRKDKTTHMKAAIEGLNRLRELMREGKWDVIVCDELISAVELNLLTEGDIIDIIQNKPENTTLVLTGHKRFKKLFAVCDLVTEMKMIKHPYYKGIMARKGIDF